MKSGNFLRFSQHFALSSALSMGANYEAWEVPGGAQE